MSRGFASNYRIVLLAAVIFGALAAAGARLVQLHVTDRAKLVSHIEQARRAIEPLYARRGDILDAHEQILATSRSLIVVAVDPQMVRKEDEGKLPELARLLALPVSDVARAFATKTRPASAPAPAAKNAPLTLTVTATSGESDDSEPGATPGERRIRYTKLSESVEERVYDEIAALGIKGLRGDRIYRRAYPHHQLASHVVGYVNREEVPATGVEQFADFYLRGQDGWRESEKDGKRRELAQFRNREVPATNGFSVVLSLDTVVQHMVEEEMGNIARTFRPEKATIIVSDARTGFVLAMANYPTFDLNTYNTLGKEDERAMRNIAVADILEPGSTFKIVAASGALEDKLVTPGTRFDCSLDSVFYKGRDRGLPKEDHRFDHPLTVSEIISHSSNKGAAQLGMLLGEERLYFYARAYGFGDYTGFPAIYPEARGMLAPINKWSGSDITRIPMGHTIAATPLQIHYAMGVIASGGELLRPQLVTEVRDASGEAVYRFGRAARHRVVSAQTAQAVAGMLERATFKEEGTAPEAAIPGFQVAGKTGTAQMLINGRYSSSQHIGSFVGFFPASRPEVVISVIVHNGRPPGGGNGYGRVVAAPSFKKIGEQLIQYLDIKPVLEPSRSLVVMQGARK